MFSKSKNQDWPGKIKNDGHVLIFNPDTAPSGQSDVPRVNKGMLEQGNGGYYNYDFHQAHFHWGSLSGQGSEHRIDDVE